MTETNGFSRIDAEITKLRDLLIAKNKDYGNSSGEIPPLVPKLSPTDAILVRMGDKIARLVHLTQVGVALVKDETLKDTVRDLAGYCVLFLVHSEDAPSAKPKTAPKKTARKVLKPTVRVAPSGSKEMKPTKGKK